MWLAECLQKNLSVSIILVTASFLLSNCEKEEQNNIQDDSITGEIQKIETAYVEGAIKIENIDDGSLKIETRANPEFMAKIEKELESSYSKQTTYLKATSQLGVFKVGTCGSYKTLDILMDTEDGGYRNSHIGGYVGDSYVDPTDNNVHLLFCVVGVMPACGTGGNNFALQLGNSFNTTNVLQIQRYFDCEDNKCKSQAYYNNARIYEMGDSRFYSNITLTWIYTEAASGNNLGFNYGMLGSLTGYNDNFIYTDDEDNGNANVLKIRSNISGTWKIENYNRVYHSAILDRIIEETVNTRMYFHLITTHE